ncbi:MAG: lysophospholipid acyltransferase family protein [Holophagales bacterium]|nr:MAG: lysophospholipid acyltransferase family protein [Holophagales bacterium]
MQWKMARQGKLAARINTWALNHGFPALAWLAPRARRGFLLANARWIIALVMTLHHRPKKAIAANLARILGADPRSRQVRRATAEMLRHFAYYWTDLFRFAQLPSEEARRLIVRDDGGEHVERLRAEGRPILLLTAHLGNWELGGVLLAHKQLPVSVVYVKDAFAEAERFRSNLRTQGGVEQVPIRPNDPFASLPVLRALREGRLVALQGDRDFDDHGLEMDFFGAPARFPPGPFHLARMTGAAVVPAFVVYSPDYRFEIEFGKPIEVARDGDREVAVATALRAWVQVLEGAVRAHPTQWYTFYDFWNPPPAKAPGVEPAAEASRPAASTPLSAPTHESLR